MCAITAANFYIPPHLEGCHTDHQQVTQLHPVNLAVMLHFYKMSQLRDIQGNTLVKSPVKTETPNFNFFKHNFSELIAQDTDADLSLRHIMKKAESDSIIYQSLAETMLDEHDFSLESTPWSTWILFAISSAVALVAILASLYLAVRVWWLPLQ